MLNTFQEENYEDNKKSNSIFRNIIHGAVKIRGKLILTFLSTFIPASLLFGYGAYINKMNSDKASETVSDIMPVSIAYSNIEKNINKVQKWLTHISATRATEGYDKGFTKAEEFYTRALKDFDVLIKKYKSSARSCWSNFS